MKKVLFLICILCLSASKGFAYSASAASKTLGAFVLGSIQLVDMAPIVDPGIGGGLFFDYRFNERFSLTVDGFFTMQDGTDTSAAEGSILFLGIPTTTFKIYLLSTETRWDPYLGIGVGFYTLTEGNVNNNTNGYGMGAQVETGFDYYLADNLALGVGGTYRTVGLINSLSQSANATTFIPYTLFGRLGYRF